MGLFSRFRKTDDSDSSAARNTQAETNEHASELGDEHTDGAGPSVFGATGDADGQTVEATDAAADSDDEFAKEAPLDRVSAGPWDANEDADPEINRIELGALSVPVLDGMQIQLEAEEETGRIMAVSLIQDEGSLQLQAFAAPKSEGLWREVREQIAENITESGGEARELYADVGTELLAKIPAVAPDGREGFRPARFIGVDGPRWFLRGVLGGAAAVDDEVRATLVEIFRGVIVDRGHEAMPPREVLLITPPNVDEDDDAEETGEDINPFERGPEITEVR